jgi:hydroxybutyrate-dimer hydrolase
MRFARRVPVGALLAALATLAHAREPGQFLERPAFVSGPILHATYDGKSDDLLTAGLGKSGLAGPAPTFANPLQPTAAELRRLAIYNNYRALVDITAAGGYGVLYGPNIDDAGNPTLGEGLVAGDEYLAFADDGSGRENVTTMVQIPASFDAARACIVTATSSGSRGVYGAIATAGEWGLKHGCAVAYTDKGTGIGAHDLTRDTVNLITGERAGAVAAGAASNFTAPLSPDALAAFNAAKPNRFAVKHAHSRLDPEKDWGRDTLRAIELAFFLLNQQLGRPDPRGEGKGLVFTPKNTLVIASSVSNGGGAALAAAEEDDEGLISGVVAGEPQIQVVPDARRQILFGGVPVAANGKPLFDYTTIANLLQPCAAYAAAAAGSPLLAAVPQPLAQARCAALQAAGVLAATTFQAQADEALSLLHAAGWLPDSDLIHASHYALATVAIAVTYANAYGRFGVEEQPCGFAFAATDAATGRPIPLPDAAEAAIFSTGNGIPPMSGVNIIQELAPGGPILDARAANPATGALDLDAPGALCLRALATGQGTDAFGTQLGIAQVLKRADLGGKPAILVQGRSDALVPVNHASRAFVAENRLAEQGRSRVRYLEVTNAQHFDAFLPAIPGYSNRFLPLHRYFVQAMDLMLRHLRDRAPLPESQVVRTIPRGGAPGAAPPITAANVPLAPLVPADADRITFVGNALSIPQ